VHERGATLSQGERQLLSFARALAFDPTILVLDEATSSVDTETELLIRDALRVLLRDRTALVIAHRLSTIQFVDRILVVQRGRIREEGTHQALMETGGLYRRLGRSAALDRLGARCGVPPVRLDPADWVPRPSALRLASRPL
jgi:ABC-type multidrug transport system fused ATPase/permease subunit